MTIELNGGSYQLEGPTDLQSLVERIQGEKGIEGVAVAMDREVVPRSEWTEKEVSEGASVEIIRATQGG